MKKHLALFAVFALLLSLFGACGNKPETPDATTDATPAPTAQTTAAPSTTQASAPTEEPSPYHFAAGNFPKDERGLATQHYSYEMPISTTDEVLTMWTTSYTPQYIPEAGYASMDLPSYDRDLTGVNIEYSIVSTERRKENLGVLLASDDLLDIMCWAKQFFPGQEIDMINDGYFANIYDYKDYAPNFFYLIANAVPEDKDTYYRHFLAEDKVASMWVIYANPYINGCYCVRGDWMDELGLNPDDVKTWDDLYELLNLVKVEYPDCEYPFALVQSIDMSSAWVFTSYDTIPYVSTTTLGPIFTVDGKVHFSNTGDNDKAFMTELLRFMDADLVQPGWTGRIYAGEYQELTDTGKVFYNFSTCSGTQSKTNVDPDAYWVPLGNPLRTPDQVMKVGMDIGRVLASNTFNFSSTCENLELAISWCDWLYSPEGGELWSYGLEGQCWEYDENGSMLKFRTV